MGNGQQAMRSQAHPLLPETLRPLFWSLAFDSLDAARHKKTIITHVVNYGSLAHWRWLVENYGIETIRDVLRHMPETEIRVRAARLAGVVFNVTFQHAPRSSHA